MKIYVVCEFDGNEKDIVLVTTNFNKAEDRMLSIDYGYIQVWENDVFISYYEYDDNRVLQLKSVDKFYC